MCFCWSDKLCERSTCSDLVFCSQEMSDVVFLKVDVDELGDTAARLDVSAMPTFLFFKGGNKVDTLVGADTGKLKALVDKHKSA
jgi:thioredoxin 1